MSDGVIEFEGLAMSWDHFVTSAGRRCQFTPGAFDRFATATESGHVPLWVCHLGDLQLTKAKGSSIRWGVDHAGLWCRFSIAQATALDRAVCVAIKHRYLPALSLGIDINGHHQIGSGDDQYSLIHEIFMRELSVVDVPGCPAAFICAVGETPRTVKTLPANSADKSRLLWLCKELDIDPEPTVAAKPAIVTPADDDQLYRDVGIRVQPRALSKPVQSQIQSNAKLLASSRSLAAASAWIQAMDTDRVSAQVQILQTAGVSPSALFNPMFSRFPVRSRNHV